MNLLRTLGWLDGWLVIRAFLIVEIALIGAIFLAPPATFNLPTWVHMAGIMGETAWGWTLIGVAALVLLSRWAGPWGRIAGAALLVCTYITVSVLAVASTPQAVIPYLLLLTAQLGMMSALRTAARNAPAAMRSHGP